jgi:hypothetical protein
VLPAQYSADNEASGTMRVFDTLDYTVYYSDSEDIWQPTFWRVEEAVIGSNKMITVEVTDLSGIVRVGVGYATGDGWWHTANMSPTPADPDVWTGVIPYTAVVAYFIQAVDGAGNVGTETNKNWYYGPDTAPPLTTAQLDPLEPDNNGWYSTLPVIITLTAVDGQSEVAYTHYRLNGGVWQTYSQPIVLNSNGIFNLDFFSADEVGNTEEIRTITIRIDTTSATYKTFLPIIFNLY